VEKKHKKQKPAYLITAKDEVKLCLSPTGSSILLKPNGLLAALKVQELKDGFGRQYNHATKQYVQVWKKESKATDFLESGRLDQLVKELENLGVNATVDSQLQNWMKKKERWLKRQLTPNEQWILKDEEWEELHQEEGIRGKYPELYQQQKRRLERLGIDWLWDFQKDDVIRMSTLRSCVALCLIHLSTILVDSFLKNPSGSIAPT